MSIELMLMLDANKFLYAVNHRAESTVVSLCADISTQECLWALKIILFCVFSQLVGRVLEANPNMNPYDIRKRCIGDLCYNTSLVEKYLNSPKVQAQLGVHKEWNVCASKVYNIERSIIPYMPHTFLIITCCILFWLNFVEQLQCINPGNKG